MKSLKARYYLFPLQLEHDFQILAYSKFKRIEEALELTIESFANNASKDTWLVFKSHPFDPGMTNWRKKLADLARKYNVAERVVYVRGGFLAEMIDSSLGMVTINSTSALQALQRRCPVLALGEAIYSIAGLTYQKPIDQFWNDLQPADPVLVNDFIKVVAATIQIRGVFFSEPGLTNATDEAVERIYNQRVGRV